MTEANYPALPHRQLTAVGPEATQCLSGMSCLRVAAQRHTLVLTTWTANLTINITFQSSVHARLQIFLSQMAYSHHAQRLLLALPSAQLYKERLAAISLDAECQAGQLLLVTEAVAAPRL